MKLALEDAHLVAQDDQFEVFVDVAAMAQRHKRQEPAEAEVDEGEGHVRCWPARGEECQLRALIEVLAPFTTISTLSSMAGPAEEGTNSFRTRQ